MIIEGWFSIKHVELFVQGRPYDDKGFSSVFTIGRYKIIFDQARK